MFKPSCRILPLLLQCSMLRSHFQLLVILNLNLSFIGEPNFLPSILIFADLLQIYLIFMMISVIYTNNLEYRDYTLCLDSVRHFIIFQSFTLIIHVAKCLVEFNTVFFLVRNIICFFFTLIQAEQLSYAQKWDFFVIVIMAALWMIIPSDGIASITSWFMHRVIKVHI